ncbi:hypothetical protein [Lacinutrix sp.]|uniref:hypothetical protein n=1 Tax=Lacinutrix sp. TaxID=1937692 RepID=UPI0025C62AB7|nr:hypothetical protein [Lacinutrix sp.]
MADHSISEENKIFLKEFYSLVNELDDKKELEKTAQIKLNHLIKVAEFLVIAKPQSHTKNHKENLLKYLELLLLYFNSNEYAKTDYVILKTSLLYSIKQWMWKYGYRSTYELINFRIYSGLFVDFVIWLILYKEHFYFVPIITLIYISYGIKDFWRVKKENKLLNLI